MNKNVLFLSSILSATSLMHSAVAQSTPDIYKAKCAMCHGADGTANTPGGKALKARDFHDAEVIKATDADLILAITNGKGKMQAYNKQLSAEQIKGLVAYIRNIQKSGK